MKKPIIGISLDFVNSSTEERYSIFPWYALRKNYADMIIKAGGLPLMIPYFPNAIEDIIDSIDGLLIPGGGADIDPKLYNEEITSDTVEVNEDRSHFEFALAKMALARNIPFLGICNGMQVLNVALGGSLIQNIPDHIKSNINHQQGTPRDVPSHQISISSNTKLSKIAHNITECMVNSTHHQAVKKLGDGLIVSALAPDGIIEAIESTKHRFAIGVEWHPEYHNSDLDLNLFKTLVEACDK